MSAYPDRYIVVDTETNVPDDRGCWFEASLEFRLGVAKVIDPDGPSPQSPTYLDFDDVDMFHCHVAGMPRTSLPIYVFAHNAGFDLRILKFFDYLADGWYSLFPPGRGPGSGRMRMPLIVLENPPLIIKTWRPDGQEITWLDTFQWVNMSLKSIGKNMGVEKGVMPPADAPIGEWYDYCRIDVDVLDHALNNIWSWLKRNKVRAFHPTRAGQSRLIYREKYEHKRIIYPDDSSILHLDRVGYYGGRTDLWRVGTVSGPIYQLDINSLYPYVMRENWYPVEQIECGDASTDKSRDVTLCPSCVTAEVYLDSPDVGYPVRCRDGTVFCRGRVRTVLPGPEFKGAVASGHVVRVGRWSRYRMLRIFHEFISDYWRMRVEAKASGDKVSDLIIKLLMNSLYGKFGQKTGEWVWHDRSGGSHEFREGILPLDALGREVDYRIIAGHTFYRASTDEARGSYIPIAAYVTSYARILMNNMREIAGEGNYFYQATDSLYVNQQGYDNLVSAGVVDGDRLGRFKVEDIYDECTFRNIHNLDKGLKKVRGSVKPSAIEYAGNYYEVINWESLQSGLMRRNASRVVLTRMWKHLNPTYKRQFVRPDGSTIPHFIDNWGVLPEHQKTKKLNIISPHRV
jgi:hypothetical protein